MYVLLLFDILCYSWYGIKPCQLCVERYYAYALAELVNKLNS